MILGTYMLKNNADCCISKWCDCVGKK